MTAKKKDQYRIRNWKDYNQSLVNRGSLAFWFDERAIQQLYAVERTGEPGRLNHYSDAAIRCGLTIKAVFRVTLRALQGLLRSLFQMIRECLQFKFL